MSSRITRSSSLDVVRSLLRSAAKGASSQLARIGGNGSLRERLMAFAWRKLLLTDGKLTATVARVPDVAAATVSTSTGRLRIDASFHDGSNLLVTLTPLRCAFAPRGAKELSVRAEPESAALNPRSADIFAAIATEVAHALWGPFLQRRSGGRPALAQRHGDVLVVDLRSVPAVRSAMTQPLMASAIEALGLRTVEVAPGGLKLVPSVPGFEMLDEL
ncbi:MAG: hypothetical protein ABW321_18505 [Polyangiales bacterium]